MKSYTDLEQSKELAEILPLESADMWFHPYPNDEDWYDIPNIGNADKKHNQLPCWSLAALLEFIPTDYTPVLTRGTDYPVKTNDWIAYIDDWDKLSFKELSFVANNPIDACYKMIIHLHELKLL